MNRWLPLYFVLLLCSALHALDAVHATTIRVAPIYLSQDTAATKLVDIDRGRG